MTQSLVLARPHGFSLEAASTFFCGFVPGRGTASSKNGTLTLVLRLDETYEAAVVSVREKKDSLVLDYLGTRDGGRVEKQVSRILGLEADAEAWWALGQRDPAVGRMQATFPGFFTVTKTSPYDAAMWGVISPRMSMKVAAAIKERIAEDLGEAIELGGETHHVFPHPKRILEVDAIEGLSQEKVERMKAVARAALDGRLDAERLRAMNELDALADLRRIRGIGPWTASHILYRGAAPMDALPSAEPRVLHGFAEAYGTEVPSYEAFIRLASAWRPFRMWVSVLLSRTLAASGGWQRPELARERASAGRDLDLRVRRRAAISGSERREKAHETIRR